MDHAPFSTRLYDLKQRLAHLVVEHEPQYLGPYVEREIANFLASAPPHQTKRLKLAIDAMTQRMMIPRSPQTDHPHDETSWSVHPTSVHSTVPLLHTRARRGWDQETAPDEQERQIRQRVAQLPPRKARQALASTGR
jgi:hypothetical protein